MPIRLPLCCLSDPQSRLCEHLGQRDQLGRPLTCVGRGPGTGRSQKRPCPWLLRVEARSSQGGGPGLAGAQRRNEACCGDNSYLSAQGDYLMGYLIKGKKVLWAGPMASRKGGIYSVWTTFYKITTMMDSLRPTPRLSLPGGGSSGWVSFRGAGPPSRHGKSSGGGVPWRREPHLGMRHQTN